MKSPRSVAFNSNIVKNKQGSLHVETVESIYTVHIQANELFLKLRCCVALELFLLCIERMLITDYGLLPAQCAVKL